MISLTTLKKSVNSLKMALSIYESERSVRDEASDLMLTLRAGVIQNFEFTYEISWKTQKRWLKENIGPDVADGVTRRELFRLSAESKLISDVDKWMVFHRSRNLTSHIYDENTAIEVFNAAAEFPPFVDDLLLRLEERCQ